jgi:ABC-type multidrug transport system ATPase subunit
MTVTVDRSGTDAGAPRAARAPLLRMERIVKRWPKAPAPVLDGVGLHLRPGAVIAIDGRNGAGKTTLLRIAAGLITPDAGTVRIDGLDLERERTECHRRIGFLSAGNTGLYGRLTVEQHLAFWARVAMIPRAERAPAIARTTADLELAELCGRRVDRLSMGQRQRLRIGLALLHSPKLLLLDEPRTSLDLDGTALLAAAVERIVAAGGAAVVCLPTGEPDFLGFDARFTVDGGRVIPA